ncbi:MAG: HAD-IB family hydrolase [Gammaproteobacteria bacterium]|nr:HAD-IB family hydrolase [Gammaproteobacteria bacterium]
MNQPDAALVVFDLDGTLTRHDSFLPFLVGFLLRHPLRWPRVLRLPFAVLAFKLRLRSNTWLKIRFLRAILGGLRKDQITPWVIEFTDRLIARGIPAQAFEQLAKHQQDSDFLLLATASPDLYVHRIAEHLGFNAVICTELDWGPDGDSLSGLMDGNCYGEEKLRRIQTWMQPQSFPGIQTAYSDHISDLPLLTAATHGVAVNPSKALALISPSHNLQIQHWTK